MVIPIVIAVKIATFIYGPLSELFGRNIYFLRVMNRIILKSVPALMQNSVKGLDISVLQSRPSIPVQVIMIQEIFINVDAALSISIKSIGAGIHGLGHHLQRRTPLLLGREFFQLPHRIEPLLGIHMGPVIISEEILDPSLLSDRVFHYCKQISQKAH